MRLFIYCVPTKGGGFEGFAVDEGGNFLDVSDRKGSSKEEVKKKLMSRHFPHGFEPEWVDLGKNNVVTHEGLKEAFRKSQKFEDLKF